MALTDEEKSTIKQEILAAIKAESQGVDELTTVDNLDGITSLPAVKGTELVSAPIKLLSKSADAAAATALSAAEDAKSAAKTAEDAADTAMNSVSYTNESAERADGAAIEAIEAAEGAKSATNELNAAITAAKKHPVVLINDILGDSSQTFDDWSAAMDALGDHADSDGIEYLSTGCVVIFNSADGWQSWQFVGEPDSDRYDSTQWIPFSTSGGTGSGFYNVTAEIPLESGYYTLATAVAAAAGADIDDAAKPGMIITFETSAGKWADYRFAGSSAASFGDTASWEEYGGGKIKAISVNGTTAVPDSEGNVNIIVDEIQIDESLDTGSTNPVQNSAVAAKISEVEAQTVFGMNAEVSEDESSVRLALTNKSGAEIASVDIPAGSGGGGGDTSATKIVLNASVDKTVIKEGGEVTLTYTYDHQYSSGDDKGTTTGQKATITVTMQRGSTTAYTATTQEVGKGTYSLNIGKYLSAGTTDIYVRAETTDPTTGKTQSKQSYISVKAVTLSLASSYNIADSIANGGYGASASAVIPYTVSGTGTKNITLYVDGKQRDSATVTRSGTTNGSFTLPVSGLAVGRHTIQMVAEMEAGDDLALKSESVYFDIYKTGDSAPLIATKHIFKDGRIQTSDHLVPRIEIGQYEELSFDYAVYNPDATPATMAVYRADKKEQSVSVPRSAQTYTNRFVEKGENAMKFECGTTEYPFYIDVVESGVDIAETTFGQQFKLDATGRSNDESNPAQWESNGVTTTFEGVDWTSSGWIDGALKLTNGAKAIIHAKPFAADVKSTGLTIELTIRVNNVADRSAAVVSCLDNGKGLLVTTQEASFRTGQTVTYENEDGETVEREVKLATNYTEGEWKKIALTISTAAEDRLMQLYINGNRTGADIYDSTYSFLQDTPQEITIDSAEADVEVKNIRVYSRAISDDEELENRMVDSETTDEMMKLYEENDIIGENDEVDLDKLRAQGKGVLRIIRSGLLDDVYETNNKKTDFLADVYYYSALGSEYDFTLTNCYIRIQGTSSTKYPSKNIRIYFTKGSEKLAMSGKHVSEGNKYTMRPGAVPVPIVCCKSDYSDSSMSLNTGGAKLFNDVMKELGLLTPPQRYQYEQGGNNLSAVNVRTAIDGMPIDIFCAETADGENVYYGQYNFNNEKSKSGPVFGMEGVDGYTPECPITLEMLNNTSPVCLFQSSNDTDLAEKFDAGAEVNYGVDPAGKAQSDGDITWSGLATTQQTALKRLFGWIRECVPAGASVDDLSTFQSEKFKNEIDEYLDKDFVLTYYIFTDYFLSVDQRAKNMMLRTWDGAKWYITYYDGDTQLGKRNDSFLKYLYTTDRDTYDAEASKYAFEGRESWLWNLCLANLQEDFKRCAANFRAVMTNERVLSMLNDEQSGNWSDRAFNKSGYLKYIAPAIKTMYGKKWPFIYALQGSNTSHRTYFVENRFALLDAKYGTSNFTSDNIDLYMARTTADAADTVRITAAETYAFGYGTNNSPDIANTGIVAEGAVASLDITGAYTVNDPLRVYGASRMKILDLTGASEHFKNALDLGKCSVLRELNMQSSGSGSTGWWLSIDSCRQLRKVNLRNQSQAKTGGSTSTALDFTNQTKLEELDARGTKVQSVIFAKGSPLATAKLPGTITTLRLEYLGRLTASGLTLESYGNVKTFIFDSCPNMDWETLLSKCPNADRIRVTGIDRADDGTWLDKFMSIGGVDAEGSTTDTCALVGTVRLTRYPEDAELEKWKAHYPELNIELPEYSMIEFDDSVSDDANISNLDNGTGYKYGNDYKPSGHITAILKQRHRVLAKVTKKPTTTSVKIANVDTVMNNLDGEVTYCPLDDADSNKYSDGTAAKLDGSEGDWMMYEPHYWSKGINDYLGGKHYSCYSANKARPATPEATVLEKADLTFKSKYKIMSGKTTLAESYSSDSSYSVCQVKVAGYKKVRFPSVPGTNLIGSVFSSSNGELVGEAIVVSTLGSTFEAGMYLITDIPEGAETLNFTILNTAEFDKVVLSNSDKIEDMEPDWVESDECLCGVVGSSIVGTKLRACITGGSTAGSMTWTDFHYYSVARGMQQIDPLLHNHIANLFYAKYGRRDSQEQCGAGSHTNSRITGGTASRGMTDTIGYEEAHEINSGITNSMIDNLVHQYAWYKSEDGSVVEQVSNICCMGYEDIYGNKYDMMDRVDLPNDSGNAGKWRIWMPDGTTRMVKGKTSSDTYITAVAHGKYMDMIPVGTVSGSSSTYYCDKYWVSTSTGRVVYRGCNYAHASGGVSNANASYDASHANASIGSRLAFRGKLVKATSVEAFKAIVEIA